MTIKLSALSNACTFGLFLVLVACAAEASKSRLDPKLFAEIYTEMVVASLDSTTTDSTASPAVILRRYNTSQAEFDASRQYFRAHPEKWLEILDDVENNLQALQEERDASTPAKR